MSAPAWTPGPWTVYYTPDGRPHQIDALNGRKGPGGITSVTRWGGIMSPSSEEGKANARLIAAAPDLAEALANLRRICSDIPAVERNPKFAEANRAALAALAKAHGR